MHTKQWHDTPIPDCECGVCEWCHKAYEHNWFDWAVPMDEWDCHSCQSQFEEAMEDSIKSGDCEYHDARAGARCAICKELAYREAKKLDNFIETDIDFQHEVKHESDKD